MLGFLNFVNSQFYRCNCFRIITEKYCSKLCLYNGGYEYPHLNANLYLHFQGFHKIQNLDNFTNLKVLYLENNCIDKIENLQNLKNLTCLYLQNNYIKHLPKDQIRLLKYILQKLLLGHLFQ